jgi:hypothetical protein
MSFLFRFLGWALLLALPAWAGGERWREGLARVLEWTLSRFGQSVDLERVDALAPMDLALFAALVLASDVWSWRRRLIALLAGTLALTLVEVASWTLYLLTLMASARSGSAGPAQSLWQSVLGAVAWLAAISAWMLGPGGAVLERAARPGPARSRTANRPG